MMSSEQDASHGANVATALEDAIARLTAAKAMRPPNTLITGYLLPDRDLVESFISRLSRAGPAILIYEAVSIRDALEPPAFGAEPLMQEHAAIFEQASEIRASLQLLAEKAALAGYRLHANLRVPANEVQVELRAMTDVVARLTDSIAALKETERSPTFGGITLNFGIVGIDLKSIDALLARLLSTVLKDREGDVDAGAIWATTEELERIALRVQVQADALGWRLADTVRGILDDIAQHVADLVQEARGILAKALARRAHGSPHGAGGPPPALRLRRVPRFDVAVDLGTARTRVWIRGKGLVLDAPSLVTYRHTGRGKVLHAVGLESEQMIGRTPGHMQIVRPIREGVVHDAEAAREMLRYFLRNADPGLRLGGRKALVTILSRGSPVHRKAAKEVCAAAGAPRTALVERIIAAALGAQLPFDGGEPLMIVDIGAGTAEVAVMSHSRIVQARSVPIGGLDLDDALIRYLRLRYDLLINEASAERVRIAAAGHESIVLRGRQIHQGVPHEMKIMPSEVNDAISPKVNDIATAARDLLEALPRAERARLKLITLTGGAAATLPVQIELKAQTGLACVVADEPQLATIRGCGRLIAERGLDPIWSARLEAVA